ncbi:MAG: helix-turn-helix domain-containing protein [Clostridia bacterium]|nr:helix-turn-helix domain-containing protein [Clostridia bacterium]
MNKKENILSSGTLTIKELCAVLKISRGTAFALIHSGELKSLRIRNSIRIPLAYLNEYIEQHSSKKSNIP